MRDRLDEKWSMMVEKLRILTGPYEDDVQYHGLVMEITKLRPQPIKRRDAFEVNQVSDEVAANMSWEEPIDVSVFRDGEMVCQDGHHRLAAAKQRGLKLIPAKLTAINAFGRTINELIRQQSVNESVELSEMPAWKDSDKDISAHMGTRDIQYVGDIHRRSSVIDEFDVSGLHAKVFQSRELNKYDVHLFDDTGKEKASFHWYKDGKKPWATTSAAVSSEYQGKGIAFTVYTYMIEKYMHTLMSDATLTGETGKGSFDLWMKLGKKYPYKYIYNTSNYRRTQVSDFTRDMMGNEKNRFVVSEVEL
jgi:hypothetical protein